MRRTRALLAIALSVGLLTGCGDDDKPTAANAGDTLAAGHESRSSAAPDEGIGPTESGEGNPPSEPVLADPGQGLVGTWEDVRGAPEQSEWIEFTADGEYIHQKVYGVYEYISVGTYSLEGKWVRGMEVTEWSYRNGDLMAKDDGDGEWTAAMAIEGNVLALVYYDAGGFIESAAFWVSDQHPRDPRD